MERMEEEERWIDTKTERERMEEEERWIDREGEREWGKKRDG